MPWQEVTDPEEIAAAEALLGGKGGADPGIQSLQDRLVRQSLGIPVLRPELDPYAQFTDPKQREMARRSAMGIGEKDIAKGSDDVASARDALNLVSEFEALNQEGISGGLSGFLNSNLPSFLQGAGPGTREQVQRMEQITATIAPMNRLAGTGAVSDFDAKQLVKQTGSVALDQGANSTWARATRMAQQAKIDMQTFREAFLAANGTLVGADRMWQEYANAETIFDRKGNLRANRRSWSDYFASRAQAALQPKKVAPAPARIPLSQTRMPGGGKPAPKKGGSGWGAVTVVGD